ncbi:MAG TPA: glycosyltransferase family 39 protein [Candidatus Paceibacterota bacterium]|nr:glycosyltransferase family 39 protein [Candidatus Paceibacterota bacterium]
MSKTQRYTLLTGILIIAIFLRFYHFTTTPPGLYPDEAMDGNNAVEVAETNHFQVFYVEDNGREGLYVNIIAVILKVWPVYEPWIIRLPAAVAGVLTVWGLYLLVAELFGNGPGLLAAFLLATSVWGIMFSRIGFRAILSPLMLIWALWLLIKAFRAGNKRMGILYACLAGIVYGLGFYTYIAYRITPLLFLLFIPFFRKIPGFWKRAGLFILITFIVAAPIGWYFATNPGTFFGRTAEISVTSAANPIHDFAVNIVKEALMFNFHGDDNWRQNISGAPELFWPVGILFILGIVLGCYVLWQRRWWRKKQADGGGTAPNAASDRFPTFGVLLTLAWLVAGILPAAASDEGIPHALRSILALAPALILATLGGVWLYDIIKKYWHARAAQAIAIIFLVIVAVFGYYDYFIVWAENPNVPGAFNANYVAIGEEINALPMSTAKYVVVNAGGVLARGIPVPAETTMFITHSFTTADAAAANVHYLLPNQTDQIPAGTPSADIFYIN